MNKSIVIAVVVIAALALGLPALSKLAKKPTAVTPPPAAEAKPVEAAPSAASAAVPAPADPKVFIGSTWSIKGATCSLLADGVADVKHPLVPGGVKGTWTTAANTLTVTVMNKSYTLQVAGDKLMLDGKPVDRVQ